MIIDKNFYIIDKNYRIGRLKTRFEMRSKKSEWGRFGGGWNLQLGIQFGGKTVIINLLVMSIIIDWETSENKNQT